METLLAFALIAAVIYIIWLEQQPKTDKEIKRHEEMKDRMRQTKEIQAEKDRKRCEK